VFEEHLKAGAEDALLLQLQGSEDEVCRGGGQRDFKLIMCPFADGKGRGVLGPCSKGHLLRSEGGWVGMVGLRSKGA